VRASRLFEALHGSYVPPGDPGREAASPTGPGSRVAHRGHSWIRGRRSTRSSVAVRPCRRWGQQPRALIWSIGWRERWCSS